MRFFGSLVTGAVALVGFVVAQDTALGFTQVPTSVQAGQAVTIRYTSASLSEPVTITLRKGDPNDLDTVSTLTSDATGGNYTWIPADSLEDADDYALQIQQGNEINYSGAIALSGSNPAAASSAAAASASLSSVGAAITSSYAQASSVSSIQSLIASYNSSLQNLTAPVTQAVTSLPSAAGTGTTLARNQTLVTPTLTSTQVNTAGAGAGSAAGTPAGTPAGSSAAASSSGAAAHTLDAVSNSSPLALICAVVVGLVF